MSVADYDSDQMSQKALLGPLLQETTIAATPDSIAMPTPDSTAMPYQRTAVFLQAAANLMPELEMADHYNVIAAPKSESPSSACQQHDLHIPLKLESQHEAGHPKAFQIEAAHMQAAHVKA